MPCVGRWMVVLIWFVSVMGAKNLGNILKQVMIHIFQVINLNVVLLQTSSLWKIFETKTWLNSRCFVPKLWILKNTKIDITFEPVTRLWSNFYLSLVFLETFQTTYRKFNYWVSWISYIKNYFLPKYKIYKISPDLQFRFYTKS